MFGGGIIFPTFASRFGGRETVKRIKGERFEERKRKVVVLLFNRFKTGIMKDKKF